jgi:mRNA interferase MazF
MTVQRGEIYFVDLNPIIGSEQAGRRPVLVVSRDEINVSRLVITVVPGTDGANVPEDFDNSVRVASDDSGLPRETVFLCFQVRALDPTRFPGSAFGPSYGRGDAASGRRAEVLPGTVSHRRR